ncbi:TetR/AcrR family transcriptional regulator [Brucella intermedia]|uniref:TetR/AcrR family transcriptional regulator n=1 Tax=Brucella intermedia TaxID=94625 RepID=UPI00124E6379|nr:TetR/AcrR family transcriptional regulator [Brucella intermedia]KAB2704396.1 TetR/AcrR family transcriptional regulator [Brucella intermedia]
MNIKSQIISNAERIFDQYGFTATGVDRLTKAAEVSGRTFYKHVGSKTALVAAVLQERSNRFFDEFDVRSVDALFVALEAWTNAVGARGCLFLRAERETGGEVPEVAEVVAAYRQKLRILIESVVEGDVGRHGCQELAEQVLVLFEGATSAATYHGSSAIDAARSAAATLVGHARARTQA